ncbi:MAG: hypothetical protein VYD57_15275 [Pseudomonadota bacterium]|nr:hypothetical protein [Pseudomonadota bacterium]
MRPISTLCAMGALTALWGALGAAPALAQETTTPKEIAPQTGSEADEKAATPSPVPPKEATQPVPATSASIAEQLRNSQICTPLAFDLNDVAGLFGFTKPSFVPIDTNLRWDKNSHSVERFQSDGVTWEATIDIGCQPASNGKVLEYIGLTPERLRLPGKALCAGTMNDAGQIGAADCTIEGTIVPYVAKTIDLEGRIEAALTGPARGDAADPLGETHDPAQ